MSFQQKSLAEKDKIALNFEREVQQVVPWLELLVELFPLWKLGFDSRQFYVRFLVDSDICTNFSQITFVYPLQYYPTNPPYSFIQ
jgi:hypothetical protein